MWDSLQNVYMLAGAPFQHVPLPTVLGVCAIYLVAFIGRGALGFGAVAPAVTLTSFLIPPHHAVLLAVLTVTVPQLQILPDGIRHGDWHVSLPAVPALAITIPLGVWLFTLISSHAFSFVLGAGISMIVVLDATKALDRVAKSVDIRKPSFAFLLSAATGLLAGLAGAGGLMMLAVYLKHACRDYVSLRATAALIGTLLTFWRLISTIVAGLIDRQLIAEAVILTPIVYIGVAFGSRYFRTMDASRYHRLFQGLLLISAIGLMIDGVLKLL